MHTIRPFLKVCIIGYEFFMGTLLTVAMIFLMHLTFQHQEPTHYPLVMVIFVSSIAMTTAPERKANGMSGDSSKAIS